MLSTFGGVFAMERGPSQARQGQGLEHGQASLTTVHGCNQASSFLQSWSCLQSLQLSPAPFQHTDCLALLPITLPLAPQLDSLASTWYGDGYEPGAPAAAAPPLPAAVPDIPSSYGSMPLQPLLPASLPRASMPTASLGAPGSSPLAAHEAAAIPYSLFPTPGAAVRPASNSGVVRSTAEYGRLDTRQREQAEVGGVGGQGGVGVGLGGLSQGLKVDAPC